MGTRRIALAAIAAIALTATACSSGSGNKSSANASGSASLADFNVCVGPQADYAPVYVGESMGIFQKHGLNVIPKICPTSPVAIASILKGQNQLANNSLTGLGTAIGQGIPAQVVVPVSLQPTSGNTYVFVKKDSPIQKFSDLAGKTLGTITVQGLFDLGVRAAIQAGGGAPASLKVVGAAPADLGGLLASGKVDAVAIQDPTATQIMAAHPDFRDLGNPFGSIPWGQGVTIGILSASTPEIASHKKEYQEFRDAWPEAIEATKSNRAEFEKQVASYTGLTAAQAHALPYPQYTSTMNQATTTTMLQTMEQYGFLKSAPTYDTIYWNGK